MQETTSLKLSRGLLYDFHLFLQDLHVLGTKRRNIMISIIIPTLNEEKYLPLLLHDLKMQSVKPVEIIVVDAWSSDKTVRAAKQGKAMVVYSQVRSAGHQRNQGAGYAKGDILLFLDADIRLIDGDTLKELSEVMKSKVNSKVGAIACSDVIKDERTLADALIFGIINSFARYIPRWCGRGAFLAVRKQAFYSLKGFDERRIVSEDVEFFRRLAKKGGVACLKSRVQESPRRQRKLGYVRVLASWISNAVWACFTGNSHDKEWAAIR